MNMWYIYGVDQWEQGLMKTQVVFLKTMFRNIPSGLKKHAGADIFGKINKSMTKSRRG